MEVRVDGTNVGQRWRVTGFTPEDTPPAPARVMFEVWLEIEGERTNWNYQSLSFDPELARRLGQQMIEMADHAES